VIWDFIYKYYVGPIIHGEAYTIVDTLTYAAILIVAVYLVYRWLRSTGITIDRAFVMASIPYVVLGGLLRVVEDTGMIPFPWHVLLVTPIIFFVIFFYAISALIISRTMAQHSMISGTTRGFAVAGVAACITAALLLVFFGITQTRLALDVLGIILAMAICSTLIVGSFLSFILRWSFVSDNLYRILIFGHMLDASATSFGIDLHTLNYVEQHVVGSALIKATGTAFAMFPLKLAVLIPALYILELYRKEGSEELWHLILLAMIMVGMAPGIRDLVRMVLYV
jgi:uncharacterized membrane protein